MRIVSLVPSSTETLLALGADVVACTKYCEQPHLTLVGGTKNPDIEAILALAPDVVVLDREENRVEDHDALTAAGVDVFVSDVTDVASALDVIDQLAEVSGVSPVQAVMPEIEQRPRRTAFVPIWRRPWMTISSATYGASLLAAVGVDIIDVGRGGYPTVELADIEAARPDLVLVPSEPYEFSDGHVAEVAAEVPAATAVRIDGQDLFWWGSRTPAAISRLAAALEPQRMT